MDQSGKYTGVPASAEEGNRIYTELGNIVTVDRRHYTSPQALVAHLKTLFPEVAEEIDGLERQVCEGNKRASVAEHIAKTDDTTPLLNKRGYSEELSKLIDEAGDKTIVIIAFDLDHFKRANDTYGHEVGDEIIKAVAQQIITKSKRQGYIKARPGGDEFEMAFACSPEKAMLEAETIAKRISDAIKRQCKVNESWQVGTSGVSSVSASVGISFYSLGDDVMEARKRADFARYAAKDLGKDCTCIMKNDNTIWSSNRNSKAKRPGHLVPFDRRGNAKAIPA